MDNVEMMNQLDRLITEVVGEAEERRAAEAVRQERVAAIIAAAQLRQRTAIDQAKRERGLIRTEGEE